MISIQIVVFFFSINFILFLDRFEEKQGEEKSFIDDNITSILLDDIFIRSSKEFTNHIIYGFFYKYFLFHPKRYKNIHTF